MSGVVFFSCVRQVFLVAPFLGGIAAGKVYPAWFAKEDFTGGLATKYQKTKARGRLGHALLALAYDLYLAYVVKLD